MYNFFFFNKRYIVSATCPNGIIAERRTYETNLGEQRVNFLRHRAERRKFRCVDYAICRDTNAAIDPPDGKSQDESGRCTRVPEWE